MDITLNWLPSETVFSFCSRYHIVFGHSVAHQTTQKLFQHHRLGSAHDFPARLSFLAARFDGRLGSAKDIALKHTILPFFLPLRTTEQALQSINSVCGTNNHHLKYRLGILSSNQGAAHPLKSCNSCIEEDERLYGVGYWHVHHQLPGSSYCRLHKQHLNIAKEKTFGFRKDQWILPRDSHYQKFTKENHSHSNELCNYQSFLEAYANYGASGGFLDPIAVSNTYQRKLLNRGYTSSKASKKLKSSPIINDFIIWCRFLDKLVYIEQLPTTVPAARNFLSRMIRPPRSGTHPLNHLLIISWLFDSWEHFYDEHCNPPHVGENSTHLHIPIRKNSSNNKKRDRVAELLATGISATRAATIAGVDTQSAIIWASEAGHTIHRRPKKLKPDIRNKALKMLTEGVEKDEIQQYCSISRCTIDRLIRSEQGIKKQWLDARFLKTRMSRRGQWKILHKQNPALTTTKLKLIEPGTYSWLYKNDREWLLQHNLRTNQGPTSNYISLPWDKRDIEYAGMVQKAALSLHQQNPKQAIARHELMRLIPEVARKIRWLNRLPLTEKAIGIVLKHRQKNSTTELMAEDNPKK